ncbi:MAG: DUF4245 domain-containing protein [Actinomycetota bacterium]|nr:DUF4245 domain-containing protein [Actinomycetota bacterium]
MTDREGGDTVPGGRSRGQQSARDVLLSMVPLVLIVLVLVGVAGMCSFSPGGPSIDPPAVPTVDVAERLGRAAPTVPFPVRAPELPPGWQATSASVDRAGTEPDAPRAVRVGWRTPSGNYLRLSQSSAGETELVVFETEQRTAPTGVVQAAGQTWVRYPGPRAEQAWVTDLGEVRLLVTGSGTQEQFRTLAQATLDAPVLPR